MIGAIAIGGGVSGADAPPSMGVTAAEVPRFVSVGTNDPAVRPVSSHATRQPYLLRIQGRTRRYVVHAPSSYDGIHPLPIVVALHGSGGDADSFLDEVHWARQSEHSGFLVLAPDGLPIHPDLPTAPLANPRVWNSGQYGAHYGRSHIDDVAFVIAALDDVATRFQVDPRRVYAAGFSNGGAMVFRLAAERADRFTAIASVGGLCWVPNARPSRALPTLFVHGALDPIVPTTGGLKVLPWEMRLTPPVGSVLRKWAVVNGGSPQPRNNASPYAGVSVEDYGPNANGFLLRSYTVRGQGHNWPGGQSLRPERLLGPDFSSLDATSAVWAFFQQWAW